MSESVASSRVQPPPLPFDQYRGPVSPVWNSQASNVVLLSPAAASEQVHQTHLFLGSTVSPSTTGIDAGSVSDDDEEDGSDSESTANGSKKAKRIGFIDNLYEMVHAPDHDQAIGFAPDGLALEVRNTSIFSSNVLPKHFKHRNVSSFIRQLNNYGFRTIPSNKGVFQTFLHDHFQKERRDLIRFITRRTNAVVKKKKTLFEQVSELKQRDVERRQRLEELETSDAHRAHYISELETRNRMLLEERDAILLENKQLRLVMSGGGGGSDISLHAHQQVHQMPPSRQPGGSHPHYHPQQQQTHSHPQQQHRQQHQHQAYQQQRSPRHHISSSAPHHRVPSNGHHHTMGPVVSVGSGWAPPPPPPPHPHPQQHHQQHHHQQGTLFEPVSGPSRYETAHNSNGGSFGSPPVSVHGDTLNDYYHRGI